MIKQTFLHIGYPKTGTSAIQTVFVASRKPLEDSSIYFPAVHAGLCNAVVAKFSTKPQTLFPYCNMSSNTDEMLRSIEHDFNQIDMALRKSTCATGVISSESFIALEPDGIRRLRDWVLTRTDTVTIVCYVRRPASYVASVVQERVKWGERIPLPAESLPVARFEHQLPHWQDVFGRENMIVRSVSREDLIGNDAVTDFCNVINYEGYLNRSSEYVNKGLSHVAVILLDSLNALDNRLVSDNIGFQELWQLGGERYSLSSNLAQSVEVQARDHIYYLRDHWGIRFRNDALSERRETAFGPETARGLAGFIMELHKQARTREPSPFRERW